jgi:hypothetical protein
MLSRNRKETQLMLIQKVTSEYFLGSNVVFSIKTFRPSETKSPAVLSLVPKAKTLKARTTRFSDQDVFLGVFYDIEEKLTHASRVSLLSLGSKSWHRSARFSD